MIDSLHGGAGVDAGQVGQHLEAEVGLVVEGEHHLGHVARGDPDLGLVMALADGARQLLAEAGLEAPAQGAVHYRSSGTVGPIGRSGQWPRRSLISCWSFIIP